MTSQIEFSSTPISEDSSFEHQRENDLSRVSPIFVRLEAVYRLASNLILERIGLSEHHFDVGTYNGFAIPWLAAIAQRVHSIDIDKKKLKEAISNHTVNFLMEQGRVNLYQMDAKKVAFRENSFNSATIVEVLGAGFDGDEEDIYTLFRTMEKAIKPGGLLIFTIKSIHAQDLLGPIQFSDVKGISLDHKKIGKFLEDLFGKAPEWYGQIIVTRNKRNNIEFSPGSRSDRIHWDRAAYIPVPENQLKKNEQPLFWIGVIQKPSENSPIDID